MAPVSKSRDLPEYQSGSVKGAIRGVGLANHHGDRRTDWRKEMGRLSGYRRKHVVIIPGVGGSNQDMHGQERFPRPEMPKGKKGITAFRSFGAWELRKWEA